MATKVERIIVPDKDKNRILEFHEEKVGYQGYELYQKHTLISLQTGRGGCELSEWEERPPTRVVEEAPAKTISVLIDTKGTGAFRIYKRKSHQEFEYLGGAGKDTKLVMICWNPEWVFFCNGTLRFRYIIEQG